ncbi:MAG: peptide methionine sulfoxide reductase [Actinobacteria bacterium]|nr:MAG: peptide methionine sulfoxide reductase [Actinomycetota bacterium]
MLHLSQSQSPDDSSTHVVLGTPLEMEPGENQEVIYFAAGCFWGVEKVFWETPGVVSTATGYMGGHKTHPTYSEVCEKTTGHAETVRIVYDTTLISAARLIALFFEIHDPTQKNRQGNDIGSQYRSAIWTTSPAQYATALDTREAYQNHIQSHGFGPITTTIEDASTTVFWQAESYHQGYLWKNPHGYQCHTRTGVACPILDTPEV